MLQIPFVNQTLGVLQESMDRKSDQRRKRKPILSFLVLKLTALRSAISYSVIAKIPNKHFNNWCYTLKLIQKINK